MQLAIPESAKIVLYEVQRFKMFYRQLHWALTEYDRIVAKVIPATTLILRPLFSDMEYKSDLVCNANVEVNDYRCIHFVTCTEVYLSSMSLLATLMILLRMVLKRISRLILYRVRVAMQQRHITARSAVLQEKNTEVEHAVNDLIYKILSYQFESPLERISTEDIVKLKDHYNHFIFQALLNSAKNLLNALKKRKGRCY